MSRQKKKKNEENLKFQTQRESDKQHMFCEHRSLNDARQRRTFMVISVIIITC